MTSLEFLNSLEDSVRSPLKDVDLNDSEEFLRLTPKKSSTDQKRSLAHKREQKAVLKEKDGDKLPVLHRGAHGEQVGTLIVRHYIRKDSKCIQCRNCGIFFSVDSFLQHCHDQYGKRMTCSAAQLLCGLENPSIQEIDVWNEFQKKLHGGNISTRRGRMGSTGHLENLAKDEKSFQLPSKRDPSLQRNRHGSGDIRGRDRMSEAPKEDKYFEEPTKSFPLSRKENLYSSKKFPSSSALNKVSDLSLGDLNSAGEKKMSTSMFSHSSIRARSPTDPLPGKFNFDLFTSKYPQREADNERRGTSTPLMRYIPMSTRTEFFKPIQPSGDIRSNNNVSNPTTCLNPTGSAYPRGLVTPRYTPNTDLHTTNNYSGQSFLSSLDTKDALSCNYPKSTTQDLISTTGLSSSTTTSNATNGPTAGEQDPKKLITQACILLRQATDKLSIEKGQNSNAWRKMYEEEREHRMTLEAKVRDMERELWTMKKSSLLGQTPS